MKNLKQKILSGIIQFLNILFGAITIGLLVIAIFKPDLVKQFLDWVKIAIHHIGVWNYLIAFGSALMESFPVVGVLIPGMQVMLLVGGFFGRHAIAEVIILAMLGAIIGNWIGYRLGITYGESFFRNYGEWFGLGKTELRILKKQIHKNGAWFVILGKFHNFTRSFVPFIAGSMGMKERNFWLYNILGSAIWAVTIICLGVLFAQFYQSIVDNMKYVMLAIFVFTALYIGIFKRNAFMEYWREKNQEIDEKLNSKN